ncbi:hypothetical protein K432DRAFT_140546 [Lepidopterella palustris CBS 459.81]|uniref:Uncharacterized protein n=1 Tax=Lepidopterella palustris CBS 459.81 TaxID=1314670 RepID=A0A8E2E3C6_9PEZI|nr:hypothetical protein K432DRAFT_140546 [Lepidopterella palustris CBS 459.81]
MASDALCYAPDGTYVSTWSPCNSTANGRVSACCKLGSSVCPTSGLCIGSTGYYYRAGCTDHRGLLAVALNVVMVDRISRETESYIGVCGSYY